MGKGPQKRSEVPGQLERQEHAHRYLLAVLATDFDNVVTTAAKKLAVSPSLLSEVRDRKKPVGPKLARALATHKGVAIDVVYGQLVGPQLVAPVRYPNLEEAILLVSPTLKEQDRDEVVKRCRSIAQSWPTDRSTGEWLDLVQAMARDVSRARKTGLQERTLDMYEDDAPPIEKGAP